MLKFIVIRLLQAIPVLLVISTLTFFMVRLAPGDPFMQERQASPEIMQALREYYGLDKPLWEQYLIFHGNLLQGELPPSYVYSNRTVTELIAESFPVSATLGLSSLLIALGLGIPAGIVAAVRKNSLFDYGPMSLSMIGICLPTFVMGPLLQLLFGLQMGWFPVTGWSSPFGGGLFSNFEYRVLPSLTLGLFFAAYIARLTRGGMLEVLSQDYIRTARAKGVSPSAIIWKHALKGGLLPVVSFLGPAFAGIISGSFVIETIFQIPGLGRHFVNSALNRDYSLVQGTVIFYATLIILMNLLVDVVQVMLNPRLRYD